MLTDRSVADDFRARGLARAKLFDWDRSAAAMLEVYRDVVELTPASEDHARPLRTRQPRGEAPRRDAGGGTCSVYSVFGRNIFAVIGGGGAEALGIDAMPGVTVRARGARTLLRVLHRLGASRLTATRCDGLPGAATALQVEALTAEMRRELGPAVEPVFLFPPLSRPRRLYVHLATGDGRRVGFAKVALDAAGTRWLESERQAYARFASRESSHFHIPRPVASGERAGLHFLLSEAIPRKARPYPARWTADLDVVLGDVAGEIRRAALRTCSWWPALESTSARLPGLRSIIDEIAAEDAEVCAAHGDFAHWNMYRGDGRLWLIDWEFSAVDAPREADRLRFLLGQHTRAANRRPDGVARRIVRFYGDEWPKRRIAALQALAFLHARTVREATAVLELLADHRG
jgi:hypothetical protein